MPTSVYVCTSMFLKLRSLFIMQSIEKVKEVKLINNHFIITLFSKEKSQHCSIISLMRFTHTYRDE